MIYRRTQRFHESFKRLPAAIQEKAKKAFTLFRDNPRHPSLQTKKMKGHENIWEGRVDQGYRFFYRYDNDEKTGESICVFYEIGPHEIESRQ